MKYLWYNAHPDMRKDKTGRELVTGARREKPKDKRMMMERTMGPIAQLMNKLRSRIAASTKGQDVHFVRLEACRRGRGARPGDADLSHSHSSRLLGPGSKEFPEPRQYAMAVLKARPKGGEFEWWTESISFPVQAPVVRSSRQKPVGDGHGHGGGGH